MAKYSVCLLQISICRRPVLNYNWVLFYPCHWFRITKQQKDKAIRFFFRQYSVLSSLCILPLLVGSFILLALKKKKSFSGENSSVDCRQREGVIRLMSNGTGAVCSGIFTKTCLVAVDVKIKEDGFACIIRGQ